MKLRRPCEHGRYEPHYSPKWADTPEIDCGGGEDVAVDYEAAWGWAERNGVWAREDTDTVINLALGLLTMETSYTIGEIDDTHGITIEVDR